MDNSNRMFWLVALRVLIGWHFLYEGMVKLANPNWSSAAYLLDSQGWFKGVFYWMADNPALLNIIDFLNIYGLVAIGTCLILGLITPVAITGGVILLALYYLSHPPFTGLKYGLPTEGSYLLVNKTLIEMVALIILAYFPTGRYIGLDRLIFKTKMKD
jgi:thiosulfate dehydrogenase (quinone) large subunit